MYASSGIVSATSFYGDGTNLTGVDATAIRDSGGNVRIQGNTSGIVVTGIATILGGLDVQEMFEALMLLPLPTLEQSIITLRML